MLRLTAAFFGMVLFAACGDPLSDFDRVSDLDIPQTGSSAQALPDQAEIDREGFFGTSATRGDAPQAAAPAPRRVLGGLLGLFGGGSNSVPAGDGPDAREVAFGTVLPHGEIARVCAAKGKPLGQLVEAARARGFALHDSAPGATGARTFYITGFSDGCPRQLTAGAAMLSDASSYESYRFGPAAGTLPRAATDAAYDRVKSGVCRVGAAAPCGRKIGKLDASTFFVTAYTGRPGDGRWSEYLIHDGAVMAAALKSAN